MAATLADVKRKNSINNDEEKLSLLCSHLGDNSKEEKPRKFEFQNFRVYKSLTAKDVKKELESHWDIEDEKYGIVDTRLWIAYLGSPWKLIKDEDVDIQELSEEHDENSVIQLILESRKSSRKYPLDYLQQQQEKVSSYQHFSRSNNFYYNYEPIDHTKNIGNEKKSKEAGVCGLVNIGNTCYMNSLLQCLFKIQSLRHYFVESETYSSDLKKRKKKEEGKIGKSFCELMNMVWSTEHTKITPRGFKHEVGKKNEMFSGWRQQDSHELLSFLLTSLHHDLYNKHEKKSIISETFKGQCLDSLSCPSCHWSRRRLGTFTSLSLPIPHEEEKKKIEVSLFSPTRPEKSKIYELEVLKNADQISDLRRKLSSLSDIQDSNLLICEVFRKKIYKLYKPYEPVSMIRKNDKIFAFEVGNNNNNKMMMIELRIVKKEKQKKYNWYGGSNEVIMTEEMIDYPILMGGKKMTTNKQLYDFCDENIYRKIVDHDDEEEKKEQGFKLMIRGDDDDDGYIFISDRYKKKKNEVLEYSDEKFSIDEDEEKITIEMILPSTTTTSYNFSVFNNLTTYEAKKSPQENARSITTLKDCLDLFCEPEVLTKDNLFKCPRCKKKVQAVKKIDLYNLPKILVVQLKRFKQHSSNNNNYSGYFFSRSSKIKDFVEFPKHIDLSEYIANTNKNKKNKKYELFGVVNHYGSLDGGHYNSYCASEDGEKWKKYDDRTVTSLCREDQGKKVFSKDAYLLFYKVV